MKTTKRAISLVLVFVFLISFSTVTASAVESNPISDPYYEYHLNISYSIDSLRAERSAQLEPLQNELTSLRTDAKELYEERANFTQDTQMTYTNLVNQIDMINTKIQQVEDKYFNNVASYLYSQGFVEIDSDIDESVTNDGFHLSATDAGYMQTTSNVTYNTTTGEFYYFVEYDYNEQSLFGAYVGLNDMWGDYDLVSMQHKENNDWFWNNIIVSADLGIGFSGTTLAGKADKYQILSNGLAGARAVSNRNDFWNGCIFNIKDAEVTAHQSHSSEIRYVTLEGWLEPGGSQTTCQVKSEYEHNYAEWVWSSVAIGATLLDDENFTMDVTYELSSGAWNRSAGSKRCTIPN